MSKINKKQIKKKIVCISKVSGLYSLLEMEPPAFLLLKESQFLSWDYPPLLDIDLLFS